MHAVRRQAVARRWAIGIALIVTASIEWPVFGQSGGAQVISQAGWSLHAVDSQDVLGGNYAAANAIDGDPNSMWATEWYVASPPPPHELQIDLGASYEVSGFRYLPRQDGQIEGTIGEYRFYVSADGASWGTAVASGTFSRGVSEQQVTFAAKTGRYVRLRAMSEVDGQPWTTVAELKVLGTPEGGSPPSNSPPPAGAISRAGWRLHFADSQETQAGWYSATNVFDGDPWSLWSTEWYASSPPPPHEVQIDLGAVYEVYGFQYLPRQDGNPNGMIADYRFYVSMDGATWGTAVASGRFSNTSLESQVTFASKTGRFVRLRAMTEVNGRPWTTVAELNVLATGSGVPAPPPPSGGNTIPQVSLAVFAPSPDHDALVNSYVLQVFPAGGGSAVATVDLGKPQVVNGECRVDISVLIAGLQPGVYTGTLWAVGDEGSAASEPSPPFVR